MKEVAENIYLQHSYDFKNFKDSISCYSFEVDNEKKYIVFCRMTFIVIQYNLSVNEWREFCIALGDIIRAKFNIKQLNELDEYKALRVFVEKMYIDINITIVKRESPDFEIIMPDKTKIGVEVTKLINDIDAIVYKIAGENFGKGKAHTEIESHAKDKYSKKSEDLVFRSLTSKNNTTCISKKELTNVTNEHYINSTRILDKYNKFSLWSKKEHFDSRIILCVAYSSINFTHERDLLEIANHLFSQQFDLECKVVIFSHIDGVNGFWGFIDLKNKGLTYHSENDEFNYIEKISTWSDKMDYNKEQLTNFRDLKLTKRELLKLLPSNFSIDEPILISNNHVISLLKSYRDKAIDVMYILDWVNTIWFSDWFSYCEEYSEAIAQVMNQLEEIDENGYILTEEQISSYIYILQNNIETDKVEGSYE